MDIAELERLAAKHHLPMPQYCTVVETIEFNTYGHDFGGPDQPSGHVIKGGRICIHCGVNQDNNFSREFRIWEYERREQQWLRYVNLTDHQRKVLDYAMKKVGFSDKYDGYPGLRQWLEGYEACRRGDV